MEKAKLEALAEKYQKKADTAYQNYQDSGITRYDRERRNAEDMADALRMAAAAADDHTVLIHIRAELADLAFSAEKAIRVDEKAQRKVLDELIACARMYGLING